MINNRNFAKRLEKIMDFHGLSASSFADKIGVQRSSISHIISGRNKPSLDFVMKVLSEFDEVDLYWLLNGKGSFPSKSENSKTSPYSTPVTEESANVSMEIDRVIIFFKDGSFKEYTK